jgi:YaaC-like Protein
MPKLPDPTLGSRVLIRERPLRFSFWPVYKGTRRYGLQSNLFAVDPWTIIRDKIRTVCPVAARPEAIACLEQASDFFRSSQAATITAARPLQLYYCFMNLVKALILTKKGATTFAKATHGLSEQLSPGGKELKDAYLDAYPSPKKTGELQVFAELHKLLLGQNVPNGAKYNLASLLPQILPGHRLWADAANKQERFISMHELRFMENIQTNELWLNLLLVADDLSRLDITHKRFLAESQLSLSFHEVKSAETFEGRHLICLEQTAKTHFAHRPADEVQSLVDQVKPRVWVTVNSSQPYRRYYAYLAPTAEQSEVLPQLLSIYAITYYLGSITRYRPQLFDTLLAEPFGPRIEEFVSAQPMQFIYLAASEFAEQEITKPALI